MKYLYIEDYDRCGCSVGPIPKSELLGYCALHGNNYKNRYALLQPAVVKKHKYPDELPGKELDGRTMLISCKILEKAGMRRVRAIFKMQMGVYRFWMLPSGKRGGCFIPNVTSWELV